MAYPGGGAAAIEFRKRSLPPLAGGQTLTRGEVQQLLLKGAYATGNQVTTPPEPGSPPPPILDLVQLAALGILTLGFEVWKLLSQIWGKVNGQRLRLPGSFDNTVQEFPAGSTLSGSITFQQKYGPGIVCSSGQDFDGYSDPPSTVPVSGPCNEITWYRSSANRVDVCGGGGPAPWVTVGLTAGQRGWDGSFTPSADWKSSHQNGSNGVNDVARKSVSFTMDATNLRVDGRALRPPGLPDPLSEPEFIPIPELEPEVMPKAPPMLPERPVIAPPITTTPDDERTPGAIPIRPGGVPGIGTGTDTGNTPAAKPVPITPPVIKPVPAVPITPPATVPGTAVVPTTPPDVEFYPDGKPIVGTKPPATLEGIATEVGKIERKSLDIYDKLKPGPGLGDALLWIKWIYDYLQGFYPAGEYAIDSKCEVDDQGVIKPPLRASWPAGQGPDNLTRAKIDAIADLLQHHKDLRQPTCKPKGPGAGESVTVRFESDEQQPSGKNVLRKMMSYRDQNGGSLEAHTAHWQGFVWISGPWVVSGIGVWGEVKVWARSVDEGKRVIRHAAQISGINTADPTKFEWAVQRVASARLGNVGTMRLKELRYGDSITKRDGPSGPPEVVSPG